MVNTKTAPSDFDGFCSCTLKTTKKETIRSTKLDSYHRYTAALRMSSCYSRSWSPPTAADTHPGWRMSPPGTWCWGLSMETNSNFVSRLKEYIFKKELHSPHIDSLAKWNVTLYILTMGFCEWKQTQNKHTYALQIRRATVNNVTFCIPSSNTAENSRQQPATRITHRQSQEQLGMNGMFH